MGGSALRRGHRESAGRETRAGLPVMETLKSLRDWERRAALLVPQNPVPGEPGKRQPFLKSCPASCTALPLSTVW